jgi:hypothetical protein
VTLRHLHQTWKDRFLGVVEPVPELLFSGRFLQSFRRGVVSERWGRERVSVLVASAICDRVAAGVLSCSRSLDFVAGL